MNPVSAPPATPGWSKLRLRQSPHLRDLCAETTFTAAHFIQPIFVVDGLASPEPITGLDDNARLGLNDALDVLGRDVTAGVRHALLFFVPSVKSSRGIDWAPLARTVSAIKAQFGDTLHLWVDICLCASTSDGHCAISDRAGEIDLHATLHELSQASVAAADVGADGVSPSDMMDGRTAAIRAALDAAGHGRVPIMSYSTKFASQFYGPFREAAGSAPRRGDRRHYQIDVRSRTDAIASSVRCADEGADLLMVKPGMTSIDLIDPVRQATGKLVGAYQVSGEYASLVALSRQGLADFDAARVETWHVLRRAGAAFVISYGARHVRSLGFPA
jgi:porphobilinogen synthase